MLDNYVKEDFLTLIPIFSTWSFIKEAFG